MRRKKKSKVVFSVACSRCSTRFVSSNCIAMVWTTCECECESVFVTDRERERKCVCACVCVCVKNSSERAMFVYAHSSSSSSYSYSSTPPSELSFFFSSYLLHTILMTNTLKHTHASPVFKTSALYKFRFGKRNEEISLSSS